MSLFADWCDAAKQQDKRKHFWALTEKAGGRESIRGGLAATMRSHYDRHERIADDVARLGYAGASEIGITARFAQNCTLSGAWEERGRNVAERPETAGWR